MKIFIINSVVGIGSTGKLASLLSKKLNESGEDVLLAYSMGNTDDKNAYKYDTAKSVKMHGLLARITGLEGYFSKGATKRLLKKIDEFKPDIVHINNLHSNNINLPMFFKYLEKHKEISVVASQHDVFLFTGKCCNFLNPKCEKYKENCGNCPAKKMFIPSFIFDFSKKMLNDKKRWFNSISDRLAVVGVSKWITDEAKNSLLGCAKLHDYCYNWINFDVFYHRTEVPKVIAETAKDKFIILGVSVGWVKEKGLSDYIKLSKMLDDDMKIVLVGNMPSEIDLPEKIINIPCTRNADELAEFYSASDVFLNFSEQETFGMVTAEALGCGTPAIVYDVTACPELIGENCGYVVPFGNINTALERIKEIKNNGKKFYSESCRKFAIENFDYNKNINKYIDIYTKMIRKEK